MIDLIGHLLPQFELLSTPGVETMELAVWFWIVMMSIMVMSVVAVLYHRFRFARRLTRVRRLIDGQDKNSLAQNRAATLETALKQDPKVTGALWREFDESLVYSSDKTRLSNTLDAEHFFNSYTLAFGLTSSRLLAAAPTFLTAIGVLGTFIGLTIGLKDLQINAEEVETLKSGVSAMINGAAVAFMTSVWGVGLSLLLNIFEKIIERGALSKIRDLQQRIDFLYPRLPAEHSLVQIAAATEESKEALQELHERIGDRLQETVAGVTESMQQAFTDALNNVMAPAIQTLVNNASQQSTDVLEKLVTSFMEGMKSTGNEQGNFLKGAAADVQSAVSDMATQLESLFKRLDEQQSGVRAANESTSQEFANLLEKHSLEASQRQQAVEKQFNQLMAKLSENISSQFEKSAEADKRRSEAQEKSHNKMIEGFNGQLGQFNNYSAEQIKLMKEMGTEQQNQLGKTFESALMGLKDLIKDQSVAAGEREGQIESRFSGQMKQLTAEQQQLLAAVTEGTQKTQQQMSQMAEQHRQLMVELNSVTRSVEASSQHMNNSSSQLGLLSSNLKQSVDVLDTRLKAVTDSLEGAAGQNKELASQIIQQADSLKSLQAELSQATAHFEKAAAVAEHGFQSMTKHQQEFLQGIHTEFQNLGVSLKDQVLGIEKQADEWLRSYSSEVRTQVSDRMEQWNDTTLQFADQMRRTVTAISGIVDDLEQRK